jgi:hypothetical protein
LFADHVGLDDGACFEFVEDGVEQTFLLVDESLGRGP